MTGIRVVETEHSRYTLDYGSKTFTRQPVSEQASDLTRLRDGASHPFTLAETGDGFLFVADEPTGYWVRSTRIVSDTGAPE